MKKKIKEAINILIETGQCEGEHHKMWTIDQVLRCLAGEKYDELIKEFCAGEDGSDTYEWDEGRAP